MTALEHATLGEGFAYFRWHCIEFPWSDCKGIHDTNPGMGLDGCVFIWNRRRGRG